MKIILWHGYNPYHKTTKGLSIDVFYNNDEYVEELKTIDTFVKNKKGNYTGNWKLKDTTFFEQFLYIDYSYVHDKIYVNNKLTSSQKYEYYLDFDEKNMYYYDSDGKKRIYDRGLSVLRSGDQVFESNN